MEPILAPNHYVVDSFSLSLEKLIKNDVYRITFALLYIYVCVLDYTIHLVSLVISLPRPFPYNLLCEFTWLS